MPVNPISPMYHHVGTAEALDCLILISKSMKQDERKDNDSDKEADKEAEADAETEERADDNSDEDYDGADVFDG
ncbi:hypothetical protein H2199_005677 [Coniosporium tulheliwenetii]|uniref:Uncharacterized protein n=1 Tax=Coniosporium tulheliwenetii TaxID=3383036 RepID=A0ACC2Z0W1_9PEZI|nr:hypothetical protein H2199_005677 [Cladosporium sp. JES 115]